MSEVRGGGTSGVVLLSESRFAEAHYLLQRLVRRAGYQYDHFYYATPENLDSLPADAKVILPMGEAMLRRTTGEPGIMRWRGRVLTPTEHSLGSPLFVLPTFSPEKLLHRKRKKTDIPDPNALRNPPRYQKSFLRDLHYAVSIAKNGFTRTPVTYLLDPTPSQFAEWADAYFAALQIAGPTALPLSFDIETPYKKDVVDEDELEESEAALDRNALILRISFSYEKFKAVTIPWEPAYYPTIRALLASVAAKIGWNFIYFDVPVLETAGFQVNGTLLDGMDAWHFLYPQLDKGLESTSADLTDVLPWKHLTDSAPEWYSAADSDVALRNVLEIIARIKANGAYEVYCKTAVEVMQYMNAAGKRGIPIDVAKQAEIIPIMDAEIAQLDAQIQAVVPDWLKPRQRYKRMPAVVAEVIAGTPLMLGDNPVTVNGDTYEPVVVAGDVKVCSHCGLPVGNMTEHLKGKGKPSKKDPECLTCNACKVAKAEAVKVPGNLTEWDLVLPYNANSSQQLIRYMQAHKHPVGKSKKDPGVDAADAKHLEELVGMFGDDFPLYKLALDMHEVKKARTTYVPTPDANGLIHTTYTNTPWTWRFGSRALNLQNWGKREEKKWARLARLQVIARPGWRIVQADSSSAEAVIQGWFMNDPVFMETAVQSIHGWLATKYLGWDFNPDMLAKVKAEAKNIYDGMKVAFFTLGFGGSAYGMHMSNKKLFPKKEDAQRIVDIIYDLIPKLGDYHWNLRGIAQKQGFIKSPWGLKFDFFDVYTYDRDHRTGEIRYTKQGRPMLKLGNDGKKIVALLPQHSNGMFSRENAVIIGRSEWGQYMPANFAVHDSYALRVPSQLEDKAAEFLLQTLTRPIPQLGGLRLGAEVESGENWGDYGEHENPAGMRRIAKQVVKMDEQQLSYMPNFGEEYRIVAGGS